MSGEAKLRALLRDAIDHIGRIGQEARHHTMHVGIRLLMPKIDAAEEWARSNAAATLAPVAPGCEAGQVDPIGRNGEALARLEAWERGDHHGITCAAIVVDQILDGKHVVDPAHPFTDKTLERMRTRLVERLAQPPSPRAESRAAVIEECIKVADDEAARCDLIASANGTDGRLGSTPRPGEKERACAWTARAIASALRALLGEARGEAKS